MVRGKSSSKMAHIPPGEKSNVDYVFSGPELGIGNIDGSLTRRSREVKKLGFR